VSPIGRGDPSRWITAFRLPHRRWGARIQGPLNLPHPLGVPAMPARRRRRTTRCLLAAVPLLLAACSGGTPGAEDAGAPPGSLAGASGPPAPWSPPACTRAAAPAPAAAAVPGAPRDVDVTSFDGTTIRAHWFPADAAGGPAPTVLMGPGWGSAGDTNEAAVGLLGALTISSIKGAGFNVLTWDPRGFGLSGGTVTIDSADFEGRDVQTLLDWVAAQPGVQLDGAGDPRTGMVGGSYGGGIQFVTAALDCRVDAIVPVIAWHSLETSLARNGTPKTGWANLLATVARGRPVDPHVERANTNANERGVIEPDDLAWFRSRGPGDELIGRVHVPTLILQGTVDTLFTLDEGIANYRLLAAGGGPVSMRWFCGGHGTCLTDPGDPARVGTAAIAWLRRWVRRDTTVDTGPRVEVLDQRGATHAYDDYPVPAGEALTATGSGTLALVAEGGSGPATAKPAVAGDLVGAVVSPVTPARAANAVDVAVTNGPVAALVVGAPEVELSYRGSVPAGERPTRVFAQLVDEETGTVVGNQITPVPVELDDRPHTTTVRLETVAYAAAPGAKLTLQLVATTTAYAQPRLGGAVTFDRVALRLPTAR
jgi:ABC-2 type transport system ATP-binding protein